MTLARATNLGPASGRETVRPRPDLRAPWRTAPDREPRIRFISLVRRATPYPLLFVPCRVNSGSGTIAPPVSADWWAQMPTLVQLAD